MNIAEKALQLKQDFDNVYAAGKAAGGGSGDYEQGYEEGKNSVVQVVKLSTTFSNFFYQTTYPQDTEILLEYGEYFGGGMNNMCRYSQGIKSVKIIGNKDITLNVQGAFQYAYDLELVDMSECSTTMTNIQNLFNGASKLKTVKGDLNFEKGATIVAPFGRCSALVDVGFVAECIEKSISFSECGLLSNLSIQSIIDGLADLSEYYSVGAEIDANIYAYPASETLLNNVTNVTVESSRTMSDGAPVYYVLSDGIGLYAYKKVSNQQTLTLHATVGAKLTDKQKATITAKNWTLVY